MFPLAVTNDKIYLFLFIAIGLTIFFMLGSWYVKSCVKDELDDFKKDNKKKKKLLQHKQEQYKQYEQQMLMQEKQRIMMMQKQEQHEPDMDSYVDPIGKECGNNQQYQDLNASYKSPGDGENIDPKNTILMRDIIDNKAMEHMRSHKML